MNALLLLCLVAFGGALVQALVINAWRQRFAEEVKKPSWRGRSEGEAPWVTLIVPARNAGATLTPLLQDLYAQKYPKERLEVLVVDDHSEDDTRAIAQRMALRWAALRVVPNDGTGKKAAITSGIAQAKGGLIVLTDADARCGAERVSRIAEHWGSTDADLILLPVRTENRGGTWGALQENEQAALLGVAAGGALGGSPILANGANMAFSKRSFRDVGGYTGDRFASGDDLFLLERMKRDGKRISYLLDREALVTVEAEPDLKSFWQQRLRWAGKMRGVRGRGKWLGALALLFPLFLFAVTYLLISEGRMNQGLLRSALLIGSAWSLWLLPVLGLVREGRTFLEQWHSTFGALLSYLAFSVYAPVIAVVGMFARPTWKGRRL